MSRKEKKKKGQDKDQEQKTKHDPNKNHQASKTTPLKDLPKIVQSSGFLEAWLVALDIDDLGDSSGSETMRLLETKHIGGFKQVEVESRATSTTITGRRVKIPYFNSVPDWVEGPASWMVQAMASATKKTNVQEFLQRVFEMYADHSDKGKAYCRMQEMALVLNRLGLNGSGLLAKLESDAESGSFPELADSMKAEADQRLTEETLRNRKAETEEAAKRAAEATKEKLGKWQR